MKTSPVSATTGTEVGTISQEKDACHAYTVFCFLYAFGILFHIAGANIWGTSLIEFLVAFSAVVLLLRPSSILRLLLLALLHTLETLLEAPRVLNHTLLTAFLNLTIIQTLLILIIKNRSFAIDRGQFFRTFSPILRIEFLIVFFFVVLHKLNTDFFAPEVSCAVTFYLAQAQRFSFLPQSSFFQIASVYFIIIIEALIPLMLLFQRTRTLGILSGFVFFLIVSLNPISVFYNFQGLIFAGLFLFTPEHLAAHLRAYWESLKLQSISQLERLKNKPFSFKTILSYMFYISILLIFTLILHKIFKRHDFVLLIWTAYCAMLITFFVTSLRSHGRERNSESHTLFASQYPSLAIVPILLFLCGFAPYIGLKTETSFSMFSNLRTEGNKTNHLFIPTILQVFDFQKDLVEVTSSSDEFLQQLADNRQVIPYFEFKDYVAQRKDTSVSFIRGGTEFTYSQIRDSSEMSRGVPYFLRKILYFRPIDKDGTQKCIH